MFAVEWRWQGVWHSFPFLAWDLSMQPRTLTWIFNQFRCIRACAYSSNLNYAHKCIENSINVKNVQTNHEKFQNLTQHSCCSMLTVEKKFKSRRGNGYRFRPERWNVPYRNHQACCEKLWFVRNIYPNLPKMGQNFYHDMLMYLVVSVCCG